MNKHTKQKISTAALYTVLVVIAIIALFPLFYIILASFRTDEEIFRYALPFTINTLIPVEWTFENYRIIFTEYAFWRPILNTCTVVLILVPLNLMVASVAAYAFAFFDFDDTLARGDSILPYLLYCIRRMKIRITQRQVNHMLVLLRPLKEFPGKLRLDGVQH